MKQQTLSSAPSTRQRIHGNRSRIRDIALIVFLAVALIAALAWLTSAAEAAWKGTEKEIDGVLHVMNPAEPMNGKAAIELEELWRLGGDTDNEDEFFGLISRITTDEDGNVYLLDTQLSEVKVFSPDGEYINTLGREGEGPGEFRRPTGMFFVPGGNLGILQAAPARIVLLTKDGEPAGDFPAPQLAGEGFIALLGGRYMGDRLALFAQATDFDQEKGIFQQTMFLTSVDGDGKELARAYEETRRWEFSNPVIEEKMWDTIQNRWAVGKDGRFFGATAFDGYKIHCWNPDGSVDRVIEREHQPYKRTQAEIDEITEIYKAFTRQAPNSELKMSDHDKDINNLYVRDDGTIWVLPSPSARASGNGTVGTFDVFDPKGRFVQQVTLKGQGKPREDAYVFHADRLYVVTDLLQAAIAMQGGGTDETAEDEEEPEPMSVICYRIDKSKLSLN
jgi:hypothetical protein